jgi:hypothetical protein
MIGNSGPIPYNINRSVDAGDADSKRVMFGGSIYGYVPTSIPTYPSANIAKQR